jgi:hypothetical protein
MNNVVSVMRNVRFPPIADISRVPHVAV